MEVDRLDSMEVFILLSVVLAIVSALLYKKSINQNATIKLLEDDLNAKVSLVHNGEVELAKLKEQVKNTQELKQNTLDRLDEVTDDYRELQKVSTKDKELISALQTKLEEQHLGMQEKIELLKNSEEKLKTEFKNLATQILDENSKKFSAQNSESLGLILNPMKQQLNDFKKKVEDVYDKEAKDRSALQQELKTLQELNQKISTDAINLTNALKGNSKTQGSWGEMVLERVLESSGLRRGEEYVREEFLKNEDGKGYRPDVIVNLPNDRQVIIDAKTSLTAYEGYVSCSDSDEKNSFLKAHILSVNKHINELAEKRYEELKGVNTLDFIFMFIPIESALMVALENDKELFDKAFKKKIVLVSPTTLLVALKAVENSWRYEKQAQSTTEVIRLAEKLYSKVRTFVEDFEKVGKQLNSAQKSYDEAHKKLSSGRDNIVRQIEVFKDKSSISPAKEISKELVDSAMIELDE
jgi:DNA recombination protein RmuC